MNTRDPQPPAPAGSDPGDGRPLPYLLGDRNDTTNVTVLPY